MVVKGTVLQDLTTFLQALHTRRVNCVIVYREESLECSEHRRATVTGAG